MRGTTRFQPDPGRCQLGEELHHLAAPEVTPDNRLLVLIDAVHLKDMLGGTRPILIIVMGRLPLAALHTSQPGTIDAFGGRPPQHHVSGPNPRSILSSAGTRVPGGAARHCTPSASCWRPSRRSAARSANIIFPANTSSLGAAGLGHGQGGAVQELRAQRAAVRNSTGSRNAQTPPTRQARSAISASAPAGGSGARTLICRTCCASACNVRSNRAVRDQRQAFEASLVLIEGKALSTRLIQDGMHAVISYQPQSARSCACTPDRDDRERFCTFRHRRHMARQIPSRADGFPETRCGDHVDSTAQMLHRFFKQARRERQDRGKLYK